MARIAWLQAAVLKKIVMRRVIIIRFLLGVAERV